MDRSAVMNIYEPFVVTETWPYSLKKLYFIQPPTPREELHCQVLEK